MSFGPQIGSTVTSFHGFQGPGTRSAGWSDGQGNHVEADFLTVDLLSCEVQEVRVRKDQLRSAPFAALEQWARQVVLRVTYLLEPLAVLELDPAVQRVLVRSRPPVRNPDRTLYYEAVVQAPGEICLRRYAVLLATATRQGVPLQMTHETFVKLVDDIAA